MHIAEHTNKVHVDTHSVEAFLTLLKRGELSEKELEQLVSTDGIQYLIQQEKDTGPNCSEKAIKDYIKSVKQNLPGEFGGWEIAYKEKTRIKKRKEYIFKRSTYLVERPYSIVKDYLQPTTEKSVCYLLPGGAKESYADETGFAINIGRGVLQDTHFMFLFAQALYRHNYFRARGRELPLTACKTPTDFIKTFISITHREGIAAYVGLKAAGIKEQFFKDIDVERVSALYSEAFQLALDGKAPLKAEKIEKIFTGLTSPSTVVGAGMAKTIDETLLDKHDTPDLNKETLMISPVKGWSLTFFEIYMAHQKDSLLSGIVRDAVKEVIKGNGLIKDQLGEFFKNDS